MYTLTEIQVKNECVNFHQKLGENFTPIMREESPNAFVKAYNAMYGDTDGKQFTNETINENIYCLVVKEGGQGIIPLSKDNFYYVVTESGKTFKNLTFK